MAGPGGPSAPGGRDRGRRVAAQELEPTPLRSPSAFLGSDAGAHIQSFATYGDTGYLFSEFVRRGGHLTLEQAVKKITGDTAQIWNLPNRGLLRPGQAADVCVFDPDTIARGDEVPAHDMPGGGMRYVRDARGIDATIDTSKGATFCQCAP